MRWQQLLSEAGKAVSFYTKKKIQELRQLCNGLKPSSDNRRKSSYIALLTFQEPPRNLQQIELEEYLEVQENKVVKTGLQGVLTNLVDLVQRFATPTQIESFASPSVITFLNKVRPPITNDDHLSDDLFDLVAA